MAIIKGGLAGVIAAYQASDKRTSLYKILNNIKTERKKSLKPPTEAQQKYRLKFRLMGLFVARLNDLVGIGNLFRKRKDGLTARHIIARAILNEGIVGEYPDLRINYESIALSRGKLGSVGYPELIIKTKKKIRVSWKNFGGDDQDSVVVFIYNETKDKESCFKDVARRSDLKVELSYN
ncbi:DUF6266 family protein [Pedobacter sp. NJ-S-72]